MTTVSHPLLSTKSKLFQRDTFIFSTSLPAKLLFGVNQHRIPISSALVQRWAYLLAPHSEPFHLRPVTIHQFGIMAYGIMPNGPPIPENSSEPLPPGNYGWYGAGSTARFLPQITTMPNPPSFAVMKKSWTWFPNQEIMLDVLPSVAEVVRQRDQHRCFITGIASHNDTDLVWMFPPCFAHLCRFPPLRDGYDDVPEFFETASNAAFLHKELVPFFHDNAFSVDVDNDHRILIFRDIGPAQTLLPSHLKVHLNEGPDDWYLREHFRISLKVCVLDGDIREDYPSSVVLQMMDELGVNSVGSDDTVELAPMTDPRWQTVVGQSIWENVLETRMAANYVPSDDSDEEEADRLDR
ncbi:hypothetical protein IW261DRAFT_1597579 [Armillaria novae-zelandiae]|uniref:Uncharacterized protein n=1 Tax=Armillaria novae-zelandiae TaxID=153914 RepID=A0AA39NSL4_9AGAR|nr:hypothetical protein IW261DRAFT_1597579 [Armillaria novae-zelandiae]